MNKGFVLIPLLLAGCTPVMVIDEDCELTTVRKDDVLTEYWQCSGERLTDEDLVVVSMSGVSK